MKRYRPPKSDLFISMIGFSVSLLAGLGTYLVMMFGPESTARSSPQTAPTKSSASPTADFSTPKVDVSMDRVLASGIADHVPVSRATLGHRPQAKEKQRLGVPSVKRAEIPVPDLEPPEPIQLQDLEIRFDSPDIDGLSLEIPGKPPEREPEGPFYIGGSNPLPIQGFLKKPEKVSAPFPSYTEAARNARIEGVVIAQVLVNKTGSATVVKVLKGLPMGMNEETVKVMNTWRFKPATLNGKPVDVYMNFAVSFSLQ